MSSKRKLGMGLALLQSKLKRQALPLVVNWAVTGRCNLRCPHCYGGYGVVQTTELSTEHVFRIIDELKSAGTRRVTLEGGEPLLRKDIGQVIERLVERGIECSLCTNGVLFERKLEVVKGKVDLVVFSLDGIEATHDGIRGQGNYRVVVDAIGLARQTGLRTLIFSTLVDGNLDAVDGLVKLARDLDSAITFNVAVARLDSPGERLAIPKEQDSAYKAAIAKILHYKAEGYPIFYGNRSFRQVLEWPSLAQEKLYEDDLPRLTDGLRRKLIPCYAGKYHAYIECTGEVYPCYQTVGTLSVRNVLDGGFQAAFEHLGSLDHCRHCYNVTISELNLQCNLQPGAVAKVLANYVGK